MQPQDFRAWRAKMKFNRSQAAEALGLSRNMPQRFEDGIADIPKYVGLACAALVANLEPYTPTLFEALNGVMVKDD